MDWKGVDIKRESHDIKLLVPAGEWFIDVEIWRSRISQRLMGFRKSEFFIISLMLGLKNSVSLGMSLEHYINDLDKRR